MNPIVDIEPIPITDISEQVTRIIKDPELTKAKRRSAELSELMESDAIKNASKLHIELRFDNGLSDGWALWLKSWTGNHLAKKSGQQRTAAIKCDTATRNASSPIRESIAAGISWIESEDGE